MNNSSTMRCYGCSEVLPRGEFRVEDYFDRYSIRFSQRCARCRAQAIELAAKQQNEPPDFALRYEHLTGSSNLRPKSADVATLVAVIYQDRA